MRRTILTLAVLAVTAAPAAAHPHGYATVAQAHTAIHRHYDPTGDGYRHYRIDRCHRVTRTVVDCSLTLWSVIQGESICQPDPDSPQDIVCETSEPQPDTPITLTLRVHRGNVFPSPD